MTVLGIDIGGSGIKGAPVDVDAGALIEERFRVETPRPATPDAVMPRSSRSPAAGRAATPWASPSPAWSATASSAPRRTCTRTGSALDAAARFTAELGRPVTVLNDADAAGVAEVAFGAGRDRRGVVLLLTFGTGIGSALFLDGALVPNTEFGHLELHGADAELHASDRIREEQGLSWEEWAGRVQEYLRTSSG